jgi:hypothetical protein
MSKSERIRVIISSRCAANISYKGKPTPPSRVRMDAKKDVDSVKLWPDEDATVRMLDQ